MEAWKCGLIGYLRSEHLVPREEHSNMRTTIIARDKTASRRKVQVEVLVSHVVRQNGYSRRFCHPNHGHVEDLQGSTRELHPR